MPLPKFISRHSLAWAIGCFAVIDFPQWFQAIWHLFRSDVPGPIIEKHFKHMSIAHFSAYWITVPLGILMFSLLLYELRQQRIYADKFPFLANREENTEQISETVAFGKTLKVHAKQLAGIIGPTRHALKYEWSSGESGSIEKIEGHHFKIYFHDFDGDGKEELIVRYHCGAHTEMIRVYKITEPPAAPRLMPGGMIGSDFPEITWQSQDNGSVIIYAKNRNWSGSPASDEPIISRYLFENGKWMKLSPDRKL